MSLGVWGVLIAWWSAFAAAGRVPTLAVADLQNFTGEERYDPAGPGAATMLMSKFGGLRSVQVVERAQLEKVLSELSLNQSDLVDRTTAVKAGRLAGADFFVFGALVGVQDGTLAINLRIVETETSRVVLADHLVSELGDNGFFDMVNAVADRIVAGLDLTLSPAELKQVRTTRSRELDALLAYGADPNEAVAASPDPATPAGPRDLVLGAEGVIALLRQPQADPAVCDPKRAEGPRLVDASERTTDALVAALKDGTLAGPPAVACLGRLDDHLGAAEAEAAWTGVLRVVSKRLKRAEGADRAVWLGVLTGRPAGAQFDEKALAKFKKTVAKGPRDSAVTELEASFDLDRGLWEGAPVTPDRLASFDDATLRTMERLHPDAAIRDRAHVLSVSRKLERSPLSIVRDRHDEVLASVLARGYWPVPRDVPIEGIAIVADQRVETLHIVASPGRRGARLVVELPDGSVRGSAFDLDGLRVTFRGVEQPLSLCPRKGPATLVACVDPAGLSLLHPRASTVGRQVVIEPWLTIDEVVAFGRSGLRMVLPLQVYGRRTPLDLDVVIDPVGPLRFFGYAGGRGPDLVVDVYAISGGRRLVGVQEAQGGRRYAAVVEAKDPSFIVSSHGGAGENGAWGSDGQNGMPGSPGTEGTCDADGGRGGDGGDGGPGGPGGDGGPGGNGGNLTINIHCGSDCGDLRRWVRRRFASVGGSGGSGGPGGRGGRGGDGGRGGSGQSCSVDQPDGGTKRVSTSSGTTGSRGHDGPRGRDGRDGASGSPGRLSVQVVD